jgi:hypothetical protein
MSTMLFSRRQALATLMSAAALAGPAQAGLIVGAKGPLIGRAPGPVVSLERPQPVPQRPAAPAEEAPVPVATAKPRSDGAFSMPLLCSCLTTSILRR